MRSERWRLLGGNLLTSLSIPLALSPYICDSYLLVPMIVVSVTLLVRTNTVQKEKGTTSSLFL